MTNPDSVINEEAETKAIEKWLRMVDETLATKEGDKKDAEPRDECARANEQKLLCGGWL